MAQGGGRRLLHQFKALLRKNLLLSWRRRVPTALHLTSSFFFILLIFGVDRSINSRRRTTTSFKDLPDPPAIPITAIPPCESGFFIKSPCYDFIWSPNSSSTAAAIVDRIMQTNPGRTIPASKVLGFSSVADVESWFLQNPLKCTGALHMEERSSSIIAYGIQTNSTSKMERGYYEDPVFKFQLPLQLAAERAITVHLAGGGVIDWKISFKEFAHPSMDVFSLVGVIAPTFLLAASMFGFVIQMSNLVAERELKLRQAMSMMGLLDSAYWLSWIVWDFCLSLISSLLLVLFGMMFGFYLFTHNSFRLLLCLFFLFQVNMVGFAYMLSGFISKSSSAKTVGFCVFIIGFLTQLVTYFGFPYDESFPKSYQVIWSFFPPNLLAIALLYLGRATTNKQDPGVSWERRKRCSYSQPNCVLTMENILGWLTATFILWMLSAIYIDNVFPILNGVRKPWLYFLQLSYWTGRSTNQKKDDRSRDRCKKYHVVGSSVNEKKDDDVIAEEDAIRMVDADSMNTASIAIQVRGLMKSFPKRSGKGLCCKASREHHAVKVRK
ncbi:hypothetical protein L7F22_066945 [Adiantum nelumboides]|nr:hypothetical protein [Adiantum nelumboides]